MMGKSGSSEVKEVGKISYTSFRLWIYGIVAKYPMCSQIPHLRLLATHLCISKPAVQLCVCMRSQSLSHVQFFASPWTAACQAPLSWDFPAKNTGVGCHFLLQGIFLTQESNPSLLHCRQILPSKPPGKHPWEYFPVPAFIHTNLYKSGSSWTPIPHCAV